MGWASGTYLYDRVIEQAKMYIPNEIERTAFHAALIDAFEGEDWDTQAECLGQDKAFDIAFYDLHPEFEYE